MNISATVPIEAYDDETSRRRDVVALPVVNACDLAGPPPVRRWHVEDLIPADTITLLNGDGGTGKSLLALQLAVATVAAGYWAGRAVNPGSSLYLSAEDDIDELHRRLVDVAASENISFASLGKLSIAPLAGKDALLAVPEGKGNVLKRTPLFDAVEARIADARPSLTVLDTLADLFGGEENQRAQARQFVGMLRGLCIRYSTTILLLAHPSLAGMASGTGSSGSTAWNNSVRSRLYLDRVKGDGVEDDPDIRVLKTVKANYGKTGEEIRLRWKAGVFIPAVNGDAGFEALATQSKAERVFMTMLRAYTDEGRPVSSSPSANFAPAVFAKDARREGVQKKGFNDAMNALFAVNKIKMEESGPPSKRRACIVAVEN